MMEVVSSALPECHFLSRRWLSFVYFQNHCFSLFDKVLFFVIATLPSLVHRVFPKQLKKRINTAPLTLHFCRFRLLVFPAFPPRSQLCLNPFK
uniref:Uncharacterized protein n=1 Tax=Arundo donax TaxID=35708 RepID=A0A0A9AR57_ARUDO